jgi:glycosyltransferase involved in cell wall biosynthesis
MPWGRDKLTTIHKGHNPDWYADIIPANRHTLGATTDDILVCSVSNVRPFKGIPYLIEATHHLPADIPFRFLFVGKGYDAEPIRKLIEKSPFKNRIHILGYRQDSLSVVSSCDSLVLASTHGEALNKSVIEAMCLSIAPVITEIPGNSGLVIHGESGWVIPIKDPHALAAALTEMSKNKEERRRRGANARDRITDHFHTMNTTNGYIQMYAHLIK